MDIFIGNLPFHVTEGELRNLFEKAGKVSSVTIVMEKEIKSPKSRGFGFIDMPVQSEAMAAIDAFNGKDFMGRKLNVERARHKPADLFVSRPGRYKGGRRTRSYLKRTGSVDLEKGTKEWQEKQNNPGRWFSKFDRSKPCLRKPGWHKKPAKRGKRYSKVQKSISNAEDNS